MAAGLQAYVEETHADELIVAAAIHDHADRLRSYEILAGIRDAGELRPQDSSLPAQHERQANGGGLSIDDTRPIVPPAMADTARRFSYSPGLVSGDWLFVSGQVGRDAAGEAIGDPEEQFVAAFENVGAILRAAGLSFDDIVDLSTFHTTFEHFPLFVEVKDRYLTRPPFPAWTGVGVSALALPGLLVEIKAIARR